MSVAATPPRPFRRRTPTLLQMEAAECGAAALGILLAHHGRVVALEELRLACGVSRDGSRAGNLLRAARGYGMEAKGFRMEVEALKAVGEPVILFWNFSHFLVFEGWDAKRVYLNDPATGPRTVTWPELDQSFTGVVLRLSPGAAFRPGGAKPSVASLLRARVAGSERALLFLALASLALVVPGLVVPAFSRVFVDHYLVGGMHDWLGPLLLAMGVTGLLIGVLTALQQRQLLRLEAKLSVATSAAFFWHLLRLPIAFFAQRSPGDIARRVALNDQIAALLSGELATNFVNGALVVFYGLLMYRYDPLLSAVGVGAALLNVAALRYVSRARVDAAHRLQKDEGKLLSTSMGGLMMVETLKATAAEDDFFARWTGVQAKTLNARQELALYTHLLVLVPTLLSSLATAVVLGIGGAKVMTGAFTMGLLIAFQGLLVAFTTPVARLVNLGERFQLASAQLAQVSDVLNYAPDPTLAAAAGEPDGSVAKLTGALELRNVTFGYSTLDPPLLRDFNLRLEPGARVALVGGSGSGKSTVARLVAGLHRPWSGEILLDGRPRDDWPRALVTASLAMVDQEVFLFGDTVSANLSMWDDTRGESSVYQAARDAAIHDVIAARPGTYDSLVAEGGANFSGGQQQRLEIARALASNPTLLILDEATSALDAATEEAVDAAIRARGCTCLIVAHRLSTIRDCDEILVLDQGEVVQRGTHEEMRDAPGPYAALIEP